MYNPQGPQLNEYHLQDIARSREAERLADQFQQPRNNPVNRARVLTIAMTVSFVLMVLVFSLV